MNKTMQAAATITLAASLTLLAGGCATTRTLDPNEEVHYDASYDFSDKKKIVDKLTQSLLSINTLSGDRRPVLIVYPIANETSEHIDTSGISDDIRMALIRSGKFRFINEAQRANILREGAYQAKGFVDPAQRFAQGRQTGADYILSGALRSIEKKQQKQIRLMKKKMIYYSLNLELTDLTSGEIVWADKVELAREASRPIIGW